MNNRTSVVYNHFVAVGSTSQGVPVYQHNQLETPHGFPTPMQLSANGGKSVPHEASFNLSQISSIAPSQRLSLNLGGLTQKRERSDIEGPAQKPLVGASAPPVDPYSSACKGEILTTLLPPEVRERKSRRLEASSNQTNNSNTLSTAELESVKKVAESCDAEQKRIRDDVEELSESCTATQERTEQLNLEVHELKTKLRMAEEKMKEQQRLLDECREMKALVQSCVSEVRGIKSQVDRNEGRVATLETIGGGRQGGASSLALADTVAPTGGGFAPSLAAPPAKVKTVSFAPPTPPPSSEGSTTNTVDEPKKTPFGFGSVGTQNGAEALPKPKGVSFDFNAVKPLASDSSNNNDTTAIVKPKTEASSLTSEKTEETPKPSLSFGFGGSSATTSFGAVAAAATSAATVTPSPAVAAPTPFGATPAAAPPTAAPSPFGAPAAASATAAPSPFGAATNAVTTVAPAAPAAPSPFGAVPPGSAPAAPTPFGATATSATSAPAAPSPFGAASASATSAPAAPSPFGAAAAAPATTPFGAAAAAPATTPFGAAAATSNPQANGVPPAAPSPFGAAPAPVAASPFGSAPSASSPFGAAATPFGGATSFGGTAAPVTVPSFGGPTAAGSAAAPPAASAAGGNPFSFGGGSTAAANPFSFGATNSTPAAPQGNPSPFGGQAVGSAGFAAGLAQPMAGAPLMGGGALGAHKQRPSGRGGLKRNY